MMTAEPIISRASLDVEKSFVELAQQLFEYLIKHSSPMDRAIRESAWEAFIQRGLPTRKNEYWRYTSLRILDHIGYYSTFSRGSDKYIEKYPKSLQESFYLIEFYDGQYQNGFDDKNNGQFSVHFSTVPHCAQIDPDKHPLAVLNMALTENELHIDIPDGVVVSQPIAIACLSSIGSQNDNHYMKVRITAGKGSKATVIARYYGVNQVRFSNNMLVNIELQENAYLGYYSANTEYVESIHFEGVHVQQQTGSSFDAFVYSSGSRLSRYDINTVFLGPHASARMNGVYIMDQERHTDIHLNAEHIASHCSTHQSVRGLTDDTAKAVFNGRVCVHKNAVKSYSEQSNHNLLLSSTATVYTKPELEIYNDDVKCSHGATVGQLDNEALFYLMSRGIEENEAKNILKRAFVEQQFDLIQDQSAREYLLHLLREIS